MVKKRSKFNWIELIFILGFGTLICLMMVPSYQDGKIHTRQNEAKIALVNLYTAEQSYALEHSTYTACIADIGITPSEQRFYAVGFSEKAATAQLCGVDGHEPCNLRSHSSLGTNTDDLHKLNGCSKSGLTPYQFDATHQITRTPDFLSLEVNPAINSILGKKSKVSTHAFTIFAVGNISVEPKLDSWSINERKELIHF